MATGNNDMTQQMDKDIQNKINVFHFFYFFEYFLNAMFLLILLGRYKRIVNRDV